MSEQAERGMSRAIRVVQSGDGDGANRAERAERRRMFRADRSGPERSEVKWRKMMRSRVE